MTQFHEISSYMLNHENTVVEASQLEHYIGDYLVWDTRKQLSLTYGTILSTRPKGDYTIVDTNVSDWTGDRKVRHSFPITTKVVVAFLREDSDA